MDSESFTYDSRGRLATHTRNIDGRSYSQTVQAYDTLNRPTQVVYPGGQTVAIGYDREGEETLTVGSTALVDALKYNERGQLALIDRSDTTYDVNFSYYGATNNFRLQHIATSGMFVQNNFQYDAVGNILGFSRHLLTQTSENLTFTYDALNRLTNAQGTGNSAVAFNDSFAYNAIGNLTSFDGVNQSYTTGTTRPHAVTMVGDRSYFYDANGNLTRIDNDYVTERTLSWNVENRLTSVSENGQTTQFRYDPAGIRTTVINPDGSKLLQPFPHYEEQRAANGTLLNQRTNYTLGGRLIALEQDDTLYYAHTDHLGSPTALPQKQGEVFFSSSIARYKPYGGYLTEPTATALDRGYTGHDRTAADDGLGLVYMNARYYDSSLGRFISPDTIVPDPDSPQAFNRYTYVGNSPLVGTDPDGHCWPICTALIGGAVGGAIGGTLQAVQNVRNGQPLTADVGKAVAVGAVAGAVGATTFGIGTAVLGTGAAATVAAGALSGAAAGQAAIATGNAADGAPIAQGLGNPRDLARDAILGGATAGVARMVGRMANGSGCSFSADTPVMTADGLEPIADVELYELVLAYDEATGETGFYRVTAIWAHEDPVVVLLTIDGELIQTTLEHPFYTSEGEWLPAAELHIGSEIWSADSDSGQVEAIEVIQLPQTMWNFTVDEAHTYFVGTGSWLVHNSCPGFLPEWQRGDKVRGILVAGDEQVNLISGRQGPAANMPHNTPGMDSLLAIRSHVEAHAAAYMRQNNIDDAVLWINRAPCGGQWGCNANLAHMLPEGARLQVNIGHSGNPNWQTRLFTGLPDSEWRNIR